MLNLWHPKQLLDEKKDGEGGGGIPKPPASAATPPAPSATPPAPPTPGPGEPGHVPSAKDLGYDDDPPAPPEKKPDDKKVDPPAPPATDPPVEIKEPATGYGKTPPKEEDDPPADPPAPPVADPKDADIEKHLGDGLPKEEVEKIKAFAKANEMTEKQLKAYGELRRQEIKDMEAAVAKRSEEMEKLKRQTHREWDKELREDPAFGGDKFQENVTLVERLVQDFLPGYKKRLTEAGGMMPPYLMRDLAKLAKSVYKTETLVHGDPPAPPEEKKSDGPLDPYAFYE